MTSLLIHTYQFIILVNTSPFIAQKEDISTKEVLKTVFYVKICKRLQQESNQGLSGHWSGALDHLAM